MLLYGVVRFLTMLVLFEFWITLDRPSNPRPSFQEESWSELRAWTQYVYYRFSNQQVLRADDKWRGDLLQVHDKHHNQHHGTWWQESGVTIHSTPPSVSASTAFSTAFKRRSALVGPFVDWGKFDICYWTNLPGKILKEKTEYHNMVASPL